MLSEEEPHCMNETPATKDRYKLLTKQPMKAHKKLSSSGRRKRKTSSLGEIFFVDTTPGHKDSVAPITTDIKRKRRSWKTPQS